MTELGERSAPQGGSPGVYARKATGLVREVTPRFVHLGALSGRDFFDAVVALESVEAVIVRTKE